MLSFLEYYRLREGGMVADEKAEEGKSKPKNRPSTKGLKLQQDNSGVAGGPGKGEAAGGGGAPTAASVNF